MKTKSFQQQLDDKKISEAIQMAERETSGEIRVFISRLPTSDALHEARREFDRLGMTRTPLRNGVLLFFAPESQKFAIVGDEGIHLRCGESFWTAVAGEMETLLREGKITEAVLAGIRKAGEVLAQHFPRHSGDRNDLPNAVERN